MPLQSTLRNPPDPVATKARVNRADIDLQQVTKASVAAMNQRALASRTINGHPLTADVVIAYAELTGKPIIPAAQIQCDWNQASTSALDFIKNKPIIPVVSYPVTSVNAKTGAVVLNNTDVGAAASSHVHTEAEVTGLATDLAAKEPTIAAGTTGQYWRGDKTWQTFPTIPTVPVASVFSRTGAVVAQSGDYNTGQVTETSNLYYTDARFDTRLATKTTANLTEGSNLYFTVARVLAAVLSGLSVASSAAITATDTVLSALGKLQAQLTALATVARTGVYSDLTGKPSLATVATSGSYVDLSNKPTIPAAQVNSDWSAGSGLAQILNKPTIPVIYSGSFVQALPLILLGGAYNFAVTVTGATVGMLAICDPRPNGSLLTQLSNWKAVVTAANTVTIYLTAGVQIAAGNQTFDVRVIT